MQNSTKNASDDIKSSVEVDNNEFTDKSRQEEADRLMALQLEIEQQGQTSHSAEISERRVSRDELLQKISNLNQYEDKISRENSWATDYGIRTTLEYYLGQYAYIVDPRLSSISSPLDRNAERAAAGAKNYAKMLSGYRTDDVYITNGLLQDNNNKPIVMILNTQSVVTRSEIDGDVEGGQHWITCVVLPSNYVTPAGIEIKNTNPIIYFIDSLRDDDILATFTHALTQDTEDQVNVNTKHIIAAPFPQAEVKKYLGVKQQKGGSDCGWWAVYNTMMLVLTGNDDYLNQFKRRSREPAYALRYLFPELKQRDPQQQVKPAEEIIEYNPDWKKTAIYKIIHHKRIPSKDRTKEKLVTNIFAIVVALIGTMLAFGSDLLPSFADNLTMFSVGMIVVGLGLLPRMGVSIIEAKDAADNEKNSKDFIENLLDNSEKLIKEKPKLLQQYRLDKSNRTKWVNLGFNIVAVVFTYITMAAISALLKLNQEDQQEKMSTQSMSSNNQTSTANQAIVELNSNTITRYSLTGLSILFTAILGIVTAVLDFRVTKRQKALDEVKEQLTEEDTYQKLEAHVKDSVTAICRKLGVTEIKAAQLLNDLRREQDFIKEQEKTEKEQVESEPKVIEQQPQGKLPASNIPKLQ